MRGIVGVAIRRCPRHASRRHDADRILNDVERLDIDAGELDIQGGAAHQYDAGEKIPIADTPYDVEFWRDVDDEGVGGQHG